MEELTEKLKDIIEEKTSKDFPKKPIRKINITKLKTERKIEFFNSIEEANTPLEFAIEGVKQLENYLSDTDFLINGDFEPERDIKFQLPTSEKDFDEPRLSSFYDDQRIIVKPVKNFYKESNASADVFFDDLIYQTQLKFAQYKTMKTRRWYGIEETYNENCDDFGIFINVQRFPILFNARLAEDEVYKHSNLAHHVLLDKLEPFTSMNILDELKKIDEFSDEDIIKIKGQKMKEEDLICDAVIRAWLYDAGFKGDEVFSHGPADIPTKERNKAFRNVVEKGPEEVISYYGGEEWNLKDFLSW